MIARHTPPVEGARSRTHRLGGQSHLWGVKEIVMRMQLLTLMFIVGVILLTDPAQADWEDNDDYTMHYPQYPNPYWWAIDITRGFVADDWMCSVSGPVDDIHFWMSWQGGNVGVVDGVWARIWSDVPANTDPLAPWSHPGDLLWDHIFWDGFTVRQPPEPADAGWFTPAEWNDGTPIDNQHDHQAYYQVNIEDIRYIIEPFHQVRDTVYWLELHIIPEAPNTYAGWNTSNDMWNDNAVYEVMQDHYELFDLSFGPPYPLNMAFVIVPEPATLALLTLGALALLRRH